MRDVTPLARATSLAVVLAGVLAGTSAHAGPLAEAIARHAEADVTALRAQVAAAPTDTAARCALGVIHARRGDLPRAMLHLADCGDADLPADIATDVARTTRDVKQRLRKSQLSELTIVTNPPGLDVELDALPGERLVSPVTVWVKAGTHTARARAGDQTLSNTVAVQPFTRSGLVIDARTRPAPVAPTAGKADFSEDNALEQTSGPPPDVKRPSLLSNKYRGIAGPRIGPELEDPLVYRGRSGRRPWFGLRLGGGLFDDGAAASSWRPSVAAAARFGFAPRTFVAARLDWSRRGGAADSAIDTAGASAGVGRTLVARRQGALAALVQLRGDLRFADTRAMLPVRRAGLSAAIGLELALGVVPLTAGVRFEQGLTELTPGSRDRALLVELGVDWR